MKWHNLNWLLAAVFVTLPLCLNAQNAQTTQTNALQSLRLSFQRQEQIALDGYDEALGSLMDSLKQKGDIDQYVVVEKERTRFKREKTVPFYSNAVPVFAMTANNYYRGLIVTLRNQIATLKAYITEEMKADRIDNAKAAKTEQGRIEFVLADIESQMPKMPVEKPSQSALKSMVGVWKWFDTKTDRYGAIVVIYSDGTMDACILSHECSGKLESISGSQLKVMRISSGSKNTWEYDPVKDVIREDNGGCIGRRLNLNTK